MENTDFAKMSPEELQGLCAGDEGKALSELTARYMPLIKSRASYYHDESVEYDDLVQEAFIGFLSAVTSFDAKYGVAFGYFAKLCINRAIINYKQKLLKKSGEDIPLEEEILSNEPSIEEKTILKDDLLIALGKAKEKLSEFEYEVLTYRIGGYEIGEISEILSVPYKSVDNAILRSKQKLGKKRSVIK